MRGAELLRYSAASHQGADHQGAYQEKLSLSRTGSSCQKKPTAMKMTTRAVKMVRGAEQKPANRMKMASFVHRGLSPQWRR